MANVSDFTTSFIIFLLLFFFPFWNLEICKENIFWPLKSIIKYFVFDVCGHRVGGCTVVWQHPCCKARLWGNESLWKLLLYPYLMLEKEEKKRNFPRLDATSKIEVSCLPEGLLVPARCPFQSFPLHVGRHNGVPQKLPCSYPTSPNFQLHEQPQCNAPAILIMLFSTSQ